MFCSQEQYTGIRLEHKSEVTQAIENAVNIFLARMAELDLREVRHRRDC